MTGEPVVRRGGSNATVDVIGTYTTGIFEYLGQVGDSVATAFDTVTKTHTRDKFRINATHEHDSVGGDTSKPATVAIMWILRFI